MIHSRRSLAAQSPAAGDMKRGFYTIMAAQFFSSLADNALLVAAIALLRDVQRAGVDDAAAEAVLRDLLRRARALRRRLRRLDAQGPVMFITNTIKIVGCLLMFFGVHPLLAYAVVGFGAAAYSPAKYGILTELLPPEKLVIANGWIEGLTVASIILGTLLGGVLVGRACRGVAARARHAADRHRHRHAGRSRDRRDRLASTCSRRCSTWHSRHRRALRAASSATRWKLLVGLRALLRDAVARQARPDLARRDHAVLGRRRDAAVHRPEVGRDGARLSTCRRRRSCRASSRSASRSARSGRLPPCPPEESDRYRVAGRRRDGPDRRRARLLFDRALVPPKAGFASGR